MTQDYYALYTWAKDKQAAMQHESAQRRLLGRSRHAHWVLQWPIVRREVPGGHETTHTRHSRLAA